MKTVADAHRLAALASLEARDTPAEDAFDDVAQLAAQLCGTPIALVGLVAGDRRWLKARVGPPPVDTDREASLSAHALTASDLLVIPDLTLNARAARHPLVTSGLRARFYAGMPLRADGVALGSLCVVDTVPRPDGLTEAQAAGLRRLARQVIRVLEHRRVLKQREAALARQQVLVRQHRALLDMQQAVTRAGKDLDAVFQALVAGAMAALPQVEGGVVELRDGDELVYRSPQGAIGDKAGFRVSLHGSLAGRGVLTGKPLRIADVRREEGVSQELLARFGVRSCLLVPVARFGEVLGVLKLQSSRANAFSEEDLQIARLFAGEITTGLAEIGEAAALRAAHDSERRYRTVFDSITDLAIIVTDRYGKVTEWNTGAERVLGWSRAEMYGRDIDRVFTPEDVAAGRPAREMRLALERGRASDEGWHVRRDGSRFWAFGETMPVRDEEGAHRGFVHALRDRTAEHRAEEALREIEARLRESEDHFRHTVELNPAVPWTCDPAGNITSYSQRWLELTGQRAGEPDGTGWIRVLHPDDVEPTMAVFADRLASGEAVDVDYRVRIAATGEYRWMRARAYPRRDADGAIVQWYGVVEDVHGRRLAEARLRESEALFRTFAQAVPNHVWSATPDGRLDWANDPTFIYSGSAAEDTLGESWIDRIHHDDQPCVRERWARSLTTGEIYDAQFRVRRADGVYRWFLVRALPIRGPDGAVERWIGANTDIEDQRAATEALARMNADLEQRIAERTRERDRVWRNAQDLIVITDADGLFRDVNPAVGRMLGWTPEKMLGRPVSDFVLADRAASSGTTRDRALRAERPTYVNRYRHKDGSSRWISWMAAPEGGLIYAYGRDVTAEKEQAEALRHTEEALRQAQKMEAVGQLTGGIAHDFNNLLTGISGSLDLLQRRVAQGRTDGLDRYLVAARAASKRAAALTHRLLAFSRRQTLDPRLTDVGRLAAGMADLIGRTVGPAIAVETVDMPGLWTALVDPSQLENALLNLAINARDAMPGGGRLTIETANRWLDEPSARARDLPPGAYLALRVSDTGTGMPPEVIAKAFDPFFTTKPIGQGTGLGLSMIYGFARQSGGQARIESEVGHGTTVCIYLPRHHGPAGAEQAPDDAPNPAEAPRAVLGETVLVVDDDAIVRMLVTDVLDDLGYAALNAEDGPSGLAVLKSDARIDLLVTDVGLPGGMNGRQVADEARRLRPGLKILFITGYAENAVVGNGLMDEGMAVMTKPFGMDALAAKLRGLIGG